LKTHDQYINNFPRYQAVIRNLALNESDVARRMRMELLARDILDVEKCQNIVSGVAACPTALQLEAIGDEAIPFLTDALESDNFDVRFQAAQSLAYLGNAEGVEILHEAARNQPAFRVYSLVALSVVDDADSVLALRQLMSEQALETRYGAFRALKELDPHDPSLNPIEFENRFTVYAVDSTGEPMVHVTRRRAPEIVLFGTEQSLRLPAVLNAGRNIRIMGETGQHEVEVIYYQLNAEPIRHKVPNRLIDILRTCGKLGATYPDIVQMMIEAEQQHNFVGQFGIDRLPQAGRLYTKNSESQSPADEEDAKRIGNSKMIPELFDELDEEELKENESEEKLMNLNSAEAFEEVRKEDAKQSKNPAGSKPSEESGPTAERESESTSEEASGGDADSEPSVTSEDSDDSKSEDLASEESTSEDEEAPEETEAEAPKKSFRERLFGKKKSSVSGLSEPTE
jgi:hypothetical protein